MAKVHNIGKQHFVQIVHFPVKWGFKAVVRGWTQEIEEPFRTAKPFIFRLPNHKAFVYGKWTGVQPDETSALIQATGGRVVTDEDFEKGWTSPAWSAREHLEAKREAAEEDFWATDL